MTISDSYKTAIQIVENITAELDPDLLSSQFDQPINRIATEFQCEEAYPITHQQFHRIIADFVLQIYEQALNAAWKLTDPVDEAIVLLDSGYHSPLHGPGYTGAMLHVNDIQRGGLKSVLNFLASVIITVEKQKYIDAVLAWYLHGCSWDLQCDIAQVVLEQYGFLLPPQLSKREPAQLVDVIPGIIQRYIESDASLQGMLLDSYSTHIFQRHETNPDQERQGQ